MGKIEKAAKARRAQQKKEKEVALVMKVRDVAHARSEEVLKFCVSELSKGSTWNELRRKLGLGHAGIDTRWRVIKDILCSAIMPTNEDEALQASLSMSNYMVTSLEQFMDRLEQRVEAMKGDKTEAQMLKVQLEAIKFQKQIYDSKFQHYAQLKDMKDSDKRKHGQSIIFQNNYFVPRPGQDVKWVDGKPVIEVPKPEVDEATKSKLIEAVSESGNSRK